MPLTELAIKALKPKDKLYRVADRDGLCLEITPTGSRLWRWRYYYNDKQQMLALGRYPTVSLAQARVACDAAKNNFTTANTRPAKRRRTNYGE